MEVTSEDARRAGFDSPKALAAELAKRPGPAGDLYRIEFHYLGDAPVKQPPGRDAPLDRAQHREVAVRLDRMDARTRSGDWTRAFLDLVHERPTTRAPELAASLGWETARFKANMRKLKRLGLTESMAVGYRLSPRGESFCIHEERAATEPDGPDTDSSGTE